MAIYTVFDSTNMASTKYAERILDAIATTDDIENGTFGYLNGLVDGETVVYNFVKGYKSGEQVVVVDNPAWDADTCRITNQRKDKYIIPAGTRFRVRVLKKGDNFGITAEGITAATREKLKKGAFLTIDATTGKLVAAETTAVVAPSDDNTGSSPIMEAVIENKRIVGGKLITAAHNYGYSRIMYEAKVKILA